MIFIFALDGKGLSLVLQNFKALNFKWSVKLNMMQHHVYKSVVFHFGKCAYNTHSIPSDILSLQSLRVTSIHFFTGGIWARAPEPALSSLWRLSNSCNLLTITKEMVHEHCHSTLFHFLDSAVQLIKGNFDPVASRNISILCQLEMRIK